MHIKKTLIIFVGLLLLSTTLVGGYTSVSGIRLPDTTVTLNVVDGTSSYFITTISGVPVDLDVTNGAYPGWCADFGKHIARSTNYLVTLYDSYDGASLPDWIQNENWGKVNWILNNKEGHLMMGIQFAVWYLLNGLDYNTNPYITPEQKADTSSILASASTHGGFIPQEGDIIAIVAVPVDTSIQCSFFELVIPPTGDEGLTPGYWKNHLSAWHTYSPTARVDSVFTIPSALNELSDDSLLNALQYNGGKYDIGAARILLRSAVAALLNAEHPDIDYPLSSSAIINDVNDTLTHGRTAMLNLAGVLDDYNNLGADL
jgi:hypothetical protein